MIKSNTGGREVGVPPLYFARICVSASGVTIEWQVTGIGNLGLDGVGKSVITLQCAVEFQTCLLVRGGIPSSRVWWQRSGLMKELTPTTPWRQRKWNFETALVLNRQGKQQCCGGKTALSQQEVWKTVHEVGNMPRRGGIDDAISCEIHSKKVCWAWHSSIHLDGSHGTCFKGKTFSYITRQWTERCWHECTERCMQSASGSVPFPTCPWCSALHRWVRYLPECAFPKHCLLG
jgi:hypothetical protein